MNYQFISDILLLNRLDKGFSLLLFAIFTTQLNAQQIIPSSVSITKKWSDKNGQNTLIIDGRNLCNPDSEYGAHDGFPSTVDVTLRNDKYIVNIQRNLTEETYMMYTWLIREKEIWLSECNSIQIVFIPLFYCGNADSDTRISYIILYENQKIFIDIRYDYNFEAFGYFKLRDDLKKKFNFVQPKKIRNEIVKQLKSKYTRQEEYESVFEPCTQSQ